jgi:hypothetical protein
VVRYLDGIQKLRINKYQQIVIASKYARLLNRRLTERRHTAESEGEKINPKLYRKSVAAALQALLRGEIEYQEKE